MRILGIETSCDETAAAVIEMGKDRELELLSNAVASSANLHIEYGGVVPEIAARSHLEYINPVIERALIEARTTWKDIYAIAVTCGPGLGGSLLIGVTTARTLAILHNKPLWSVNHVKAHACAAFITSGSPNLSDYDFSNHQPAFPLLALIVSGGHSQLVLFESLQDYKVIGRTLDDAVGEAFDKVAKIIGLPYPGGPSIENAAQKGNADRFKLPDSKLSNPYDFSFSGLKTAVLRAAQKEIGKNYTFPSHQIARELSSQQQVDLAASFQKTALSTLVSKLHKASEQYAPKSIVVCGGVAASKALRAAISNHLNKEVIYPDIKLCTDNAAMVAACAGMQIEQGDSAADPYTLEVAPNLYM